MISFPNTTLFAEEQTVHDPLCQFRQDVLEGLTGSPKQLQSKYFYDKKGDELFQQIMSMPEYYLTACEMEIFRNNPGKLATAIQAAAMPFDLIELGAGDALKSAYLLEYLVDHQVDFTYMPIDISGNILAVLEQRLSTQLPGLEMVGIEGEYFDSLRKATAHSSRRKVVMFLGANIGNMEASAAMVFCRELRRELRPGDMVFIGFDLKKHPQTILAAYNDKAGVTARFNLNLLTRINHELDANFDLRRFEHYQTYDPLQGACRSYLVSTCEQVVTVAGQSIPFRNGETVYMEVSQKFTAEEIAALATSSGFSTHYTFLDSRQWFMNTIWMAS